MTSGDRLLIYVDSWRGGAFYSSYPDHLSQGYFVSNAFFSRSAMMSASPLVS